MKKNLPLRVQKVNSRDLKRKLLSSILPTIANLFLNVKEPVSGYQSRNDLLLTIVKLGAIAEVDRHALDVPIGVVPHIHHLLTLERMSAFVSKHSISGSGQSKCPVIRDHILVGGLVEPSDAATHSRLQHELIMVSINFDDRFLTTNILGFEKFAQGC